MTWEPRSWRSPTWNAGVYNANGPGYQEAPRSRARDRSIADFPGSEPISNPELFKLDVDVLIPAAIEEQITGANMRDIKAKLIIEGANGPTTPEAHKHLHERGVFIVPDILANAGGVTVSYFEWVQDRYGYFWERHQVNYRLEAKMCQAFNAVLETAQSLTSTCESPPTSWRSIAWPL